MTYGWPLPSPVHDSTLARARFNVGPLPYLVSLFYALGAHSPRRRYSPCDLLRTHRFSFVIYYASGALNYTIDFTELHNLFGLISHSVWWYPGRFFLVVRALMFGEIDDLDVPLAVHLVPLDEPLILKPV